jgi:hypothetical protein
VFYRDGWRIGGRKTVSNGFASARAFSTRQKPGVDENVLRPARRFQIINFQSSITNNLSPFADGVR